MYQLVRIPDDTVCCGRLASQGPLAPRRGRARLGPGENIKLKTLSDRAKYDRSSILDIGLVCYVGFSSNSQTFVIPTAYARNGSTLELHRAPAGYALNSIVDGQLVCVTVTIVEGLVFSRISFHHSLNYCSVVLLAQHMK